MSSENMHAVVYQNYGAPEVLRVAELEKPTPKDNEVLIKIRATSVTAVDSTFRKGDAFFARMATGPSKPKNPVLGTELSGVIEAIGENVNEFKVGDEVFAPTPSGFGAHAEYIALPEDAPIAIKPGSMSFEEAAVAPSGFLTALPFLRDTGKIQPGQQVLIIGASGSVGTYAVQIAKHFGAEVTGVCSSKNAELVKSLGADKVIDYKKEDFTKKDEKYDIIFDAIGKSSYSKSKGSLKPQGKYLTTVVSFRILFQMLWTSMLSSKKAIITFTGLRSAEEKSKDLAIFQEMYAAGKLQIVLDRSYPLDQIAEAHAYVEKGHKRGNVAITISA